jgi:hypothetical protein
VTSHSEQKQNYQVWRINYSIVLKAHRVTSMADTDIDAVRKQKKAEYDK